MQTGECASQSSRTLSMLDCSSDKTSAQPNVAVVNCSDAMMSAFYYPVLTRSLIQYFCSCELLCGSVIVFSFDILAWSADTLYSVQ